jgi:hypothetical protein
VFDQGKKVYDDGCWDEHMSFLNQWANSLGVTGYEFYTMNLEETRYAIAKCKLMEQSKKKGQKKAITGDDIEAYLENPGVNYEGWISGEEEFLLGGHDFFWWSKYLDGADSPDYYRDLKEAGKLPSLNADSRWSDMLQIADLEEGPPESVNALLDLLRETGAGGPGILPKGEWWKDKDQCLKAYAKKYGKHTDMIREYIGYCFPRELWLDKAYFAGAVQIVPKLYIAEAYTKDRAFMKALKKITEDYNG